MFKLLNKKLVIILLFLILLMANYIYPQLQLIELQNNIRYNEKTNLPSAIYNVKSRQYSGTPEEIARQYLLENKNLFGLKDNLNDLEIIGAKENPGGYHVGFLQNYKGISVFRSETVVSINNQNRISMMVNNYKPNINVNVNPDVSKEQALLLSKIAIGTANSKDVIAPKLELVVYQDSSTTFHLAWKILLYSYEPEEGYVVLSDAHSGKVLEVLTTIVDFVNGTGQVFDPDPATDLRNSSLTDQNDADYPALQSAYDISTLNDLNDAVGGVYRVQGKYAKSLDITSPYDLIVTENNPSNFQYNRSQNGFEEVNIYYFVDKQRRYVGNLGFVPTWDYLGSNSQTIAFDARGRTDRNASYDQFSEYMRFGVPSGYVDAGEDQSVILHEYGHAFHDALMFGGIDNASSTSDTRGISEGLGDYLGISYRRITQTNPFHPNYRANWFYPEAGESILPTSSAKYPTNWGANPYSKLNVWVSTLMDIEYNVGTDPSSGINLGRDITTKLVLTSLSYVTSSNDVIDNVNAIFQADRDIYDGSHLSILASVFYNRGFFYNDIVSGTISSNTTWSGNKYVTGNITVNNGATLTISANSFIFFTSGKSLTVNGTLNATSATFTSASTTWGGIKFNSGSNGIIDGCEINNVQTYGGYAIAITSASPTIQNCTIENNTGVCGGISVRNSSAIPYLYNNVIKNNTYHGIYIYNSSVFLRFNTITSSTATGRAAVYCDYYATPLFAVPSGGYEEGKNTLQNGYYGLYGNYYSLINAGTSSNGYHNRFLNNSYANVYASNNTTIYAEYNWWGQPYPNKYYAVSGSVIYPNPALSSDPGPGANIIAVEENDKEDVGSEILSKTSTQANDLKKDIAGLINEYRKTKDKSIISYVKQFVDNKTDPDFVRPIAMEVLSNIYLIDKNISEAESLNKLLIEDYKSTIHEKNGKMNLFFIYYDSGNYKEAKKMLTSIDESYSKNTEVVLANWLISSESENEIENQFTKEQTETYDAISVKEYSLLGNYPNPFNPSTTISYNLPKVSEVEVTIYDILGNKVKSFVIPAQNSGTQKIIWNGRNSNGEQVSSGIYLYHFKAKSLKENNTIFEKSAKLILMK